MIDKWQVLKVSQQLLARYHRSTTALRIEEDSPKGRDALQIQYRFIAYPRSVSSFLTKPRPFNSVDGVRHYLGEFMRTELCIMRGPGLLASVSG